MCDRLGHYWAPRLDASRQCCYCGAREAASRPYAHLSGRQLAFRLAHASLSSGDVRLTRVEREVFRNETRALRDEERARAARSA